jgi:hypothetical protein
MPASRHAEARGKRPNRQSQNQKAKSKEVKKQGQEKQRKKSQRQAKNQEEEIQKARKEGLKNNNPTARHTTNPPVPCLGRRFLIPNIRKARA